MEPTSGGFCNNNQTGYGVVSPFSVPNHTSTTTTATPPLLHVYGGSDTIPTTAGYYADGATNLDCEFFPLPTRKRSRDSSRSNYHHLLLQNPRSSSCVNAATTTTTTTLFSFLGQDIDISSHMNQQQHEIDRFVSLHVSFASTAEFVAMCIVLSIVTDLMFIVISDGERDRKSVV